MSRKKIHEIHADLCCVWEVQIWSFYFCYRRSWTIFASPDPEISKSHWLGVMADGWDHRAGDLVGRAGDFFFNQSKLCLGRHTKVSKRFMKHLRHGHYCKKWLGRSSDHQIIRSSDPGATIWFTTQQDNHSHTIPFRRPWNSSDVALQKDGMACQENRVPLAKQIDK